MYTFVLSRRRARVRERTCCEWAKEGGGGAFRTFTSMRFDARSSYVISWMRWPIDMA